MSIDKKSLKERLLAQYTQQLDQILSTLDEEDDLTLTQIEDLALNLRQKVGQDVTSELVNQEADTYPTELSCPTCGAKMRYKGRKPKWIKTRTGHIQVEREYYYCSHCRAGHFPPR